MDGSKVPVCLPSGPESGRDSSEVPEVHAVIEETAYVDGIRIQFQMRNPVRISVNNVAKFGPDTQDVQSNTCQNKVFKRHTVTLNRMRYIDEGLNHN